MSDARPDGPLRPGGHTAYDHEADLRTMPDAATPAAPPVKFRELPPAEQIRRTVEDVVRHYAAKWGRLPSAEQIAAFKKWPETRAAEVRIALADPVTIANLRAVGALPDDVDTWDEAVADRAMPTRKQMDALDAVFERLDPEDKRPVGVILREHGIDMRQWNGWLADPVFAAYVRDRSAQVFGARAHEVDVALMRRAVAGDVGAIKLILEMQGRIKRQTDGVDTNMVLARVVEILQVELADDPGRLLRIVERLEAVSQQSRAGTLPSGPTVIAGEVVPAVRPA